MEAPSQIQIHEQLTKDFFHAAEAIGITRVQAQILHNRGLQTVAEMQKFIAARYEETPDPHALIDMSRAVTRIQQALEQQEHITVYGD